MPHWIQNAIKHKGALRRELHAPDGKPIPPNKLRGAAAKGGTLGQRARLAMTLKGLRKG